MEAAVLGLSAMLEGRQLSQGLELLRGLLDSRTLLPPAEVLMRWRGRTKRYA
jgi:hypothetical protein